MTNKNLHSTRNNRQAFARLLGACGMAALTLAGCGGSGDDEPVVSYAQRCKLAPAASNTLELPAPSGAHCIGKTVFRLVDPARGELNTPDDPDDRRELNVKVWYPAEPNATGQRADYIEPAILPYVKAAAAIPEAAPNVAVNAIAGAGLRGGATYPVVLFSPGYGAIAEAYTVLVEDLASHGVVVVAIDHPYASGVTSLASGQIALMPTPTDLEQAKAVAQQAAQTMVEDQRHVLDWLQGPGTGLLRGGIDFTRIGAYGHSIGGSTALQASRQDARIKAGVNIDGSVQGDTAVPWTKPLKIILAADHGEDATVSAVLRTATGTALSATVPATKHMDFADLKLLLEFYVPDRTSEVWTQSDLGAADALSTLRTTREQVLSFFQQYVFR